MGELVYEGFHVGIRAYAAGLLNKFLSRAAVGKVRPGQLHEESVVASRFIFFTEFVEVLPVGFMIFEEFFERGKCRHLVELRIAVPEHVQPVEGICDLRLFVDWRVQR